MEPGKKIKQLRLRAGMTQEQLADRLGIGAQSVSKWENAVAMPDIMLLPKLAEIFGISIDELFDLTVEQRLNRIENRMDMEEELPQDVFWEYEEFLKINLGDDRYKMRAAELLTYLYWHRMNSYAQKVRRCAKEVIRQSPDKKGCQWMLNMAEGHCIWDWNLSNHSAAIEFYRELAEQNPNSVLSYEYLIDNLIADHRADEAEQYLDRLCAIKTSNPILNQVYRAHIALARFDEPAADKIIEHLGEKYGDNSVYLFEAAQYYAKKCDYEKAIEYYELSYRKTERHPAYTDELQGIAVIYEIQGDYKKAADTYDRIIRLLQDEWGMTEEVELKNMQNEKARLLEKLK